jgi:hypothetical protein
MNPLIELDQLGLDPAAKIQVAAMIQSLLNQANHQASAQLQAKDAQLQAKDAEIKRKEFGAKNETLSPLQRDLVCRNVGDR